MKLDAATKRWIRNEIDERAAAAGHRFDEASGQFVVNWMHDYLRLYEGEWAGQPFECVDWQYEATMRMFGWLKFSDRWKREIRRFRKAIVYIPKKNKKSPTLAAWGTYLLCGDGEPGQKVFFGAKNGKQAREIAGKHSIEMIMSSPQLSTECTINKSLMQVTHESSRSTMRPLASDSVRSQEAQEGLNGCVLVDETHVVDRRFMNRMSRAGISRSEPMQIEVSTAGNNPDGYGKERYDYGVRVNDCKDGLEDFQTFFLSYSAPQDLTDEQLAEDPVKYGKMANPAWGHTIHEDEYLADYNESKRSISALAEFKMYRLDIWQHSTNPWLRSDDWARCVNVFGEQDLFGERCGAGLDLSKTEDMTALSLVFPDFSQEYEDDEDRPCRLLTYYWLPEGALDKHRHEVPYEKWRASGHLRIMPNTPTVSHAFVAKDIAEICKQFDVGMFAYDDWHADEVWERLCDDYGFQEDIRYKYPQTIGHFAGPTSKFERLVIGGKMMHNANPITTWQAGHVEVKTDYNQNMRPVKPSHGDIRKIDGIVASIMALDAAVKLPDEATSFYETNDLEM